MSYLAAYIWVLLLIAAVAVPVAIVLVKRIYSQQAPTSPVTRDVPGTEGVTSDTTQEIGGVHS
jgi:membrane glycosyltransferase